MLHAIEQFGPDKRLVTSTVYIEHNHIQLFFLRLLYLNLGHHFRLHLSHWHVWRNSRHLNLGLNLSRLRLGLRLNRNARFLILFFIQLIMGREIRDQRIVLLIRNAKIRLFAFLADDFEIVFRRKGTRRRIITFDFHLAQRFITKLGLSLFFAGPQTMKQQRRYRQRANNYQYESQFLHLKLSVSRLMF
ncbi:Uncharacterised protein [Vibrio cholerae]|nr:Uncharacterised protein [Vibrio cholerae]CSB42608.1 Uncharacterised protein [Vibrio cholerae]CSC53013.1 Uncharacterised protein [Vibrio cholerae]CSC80704.1 Uncharacterised protein [Vibrio cholerae]CSC89931.1 Uncharacterised protein [Vibrio cholerae]